jgi:hypothetical protein
VVWDKRTLIGASVIDRIVPGTSTKPLYRCSECGGAHIKRRKTLDPPWRCFGCNTNFANPRVEQRTVHTYESRHNVSWIDLGGVLTGSQLRALCVSPRSQLSLRPLRWLEFRSAVETAVPGDPLALVDFRADSLRGGHSRATVRVRLGQAEFRRRLLDEHGEVCAFTGPAPSATLEAGHLYSYAEVGEHHQHGGMLLRRDVHRLFDLGQLAVDPTSLRIDVHPDLAAYDSYAAIDGRPLAIQLTRTHRRWLAEHWAVHRKASSQTA